MRVKVIINPAAGKEEPILGVLDTVFTELDIEWDVAITHAAGDGIAAALQAADGGFDLIGAYGGDGTVSEVASALAQGGPPMLLLPGGTGNVLAEELGIPPTLAEAAALAGENAAEVKRVDMGKTGDRWFIVRLTTGFESTVVEEATRELKLRYGRFAYPIAALKTLVDPPVAHYSLVIDGREIEGEGVEVMVANSAGTGVTGIQLADEVDVSDGLLDVLLLESTDIPNLIASAADAAAGQPPRLVTRWRGTTIHIEATPAQGVSIDGEAEGLTPLDVVTVPGAIGVLVPRSE